MVLAAAAIQACMQTDNLILLLRCVLPHGCFGMRLHLCMCVNEWVQNIKLALSIIKLLINSWRKTLATMHCIWWHRMVRPTCLHFICIQYILSLSLSATDTHTHGLEMHRLCYMCVEPFVSANPPQHNTCVACMWLSISALRHILRVSFTSLLVFAPHTNTLVITRTHDVDANLMMNAWWKLARRWPTTQHNHVNLLKYDRMRIIKIFSRPHQNTLVFILLIFFFLFKKNWWAFWMCCKSKYHSSNVNVTDVSCMVRPIGRAMARRQHSQTALQNVDSQPRAAFPHWKIFRINK